MNDSSLTTVENVKVKPWRSLDEDKHLKSAKAGLRSYLESLPDDQVQVLFSEVKKNSNCTKMPAFQVWGLVTSQMDRHFKIRDDSDVKTKPVNSKGVSLGMATLNYYNDDLPDGWKFEDGKDIKLEQQGNGFLVTCPPVDSDDADLGGSSMSFPKIDPKDQVRYAAYHEATHAFFGVFFSLGLFGGVEIDEYGLGFTATRAVNLFTNSIVDKHIDDAIILLAPAIVEHTLADMPYDVVDRETAIDVIDGFPLLDYPFDVDDVQEYIDECSWDFSKAIVTLTMASLKQKRVFEAFGQEMTKGQVYKMTLSNYEIAANSASELVADARVIEPICVLAEELYKKRRLTKGEVINLFDPFF